MNKAKIFIRRTTIITIVTVQVLFFPAFTFAADNPDVGVNRDNNTPGTTYDVTGAKKQQAAEAAPATTPETAPTTSSTPTQAASTTSTAAPTTPAGTTTSTTNGTSDTKATTNTQADVTNNITGNSQSGDATVHDNTYAGSATSGDTMTVANLFNLLQSQSNVVGQSNMVTFMKNVDGNVYGDILIDPTALPTIQNTLANASDVQVNNQGTITNNVGLTATSGKAVVRDNNYAGNATSGDAATLANIFNMINSSITAGSSFMGVININGNLDGDILFPPGVLDILLANNTGSIPTATISASGTNDLTANLSNTQSIDNAITTTAQTGAATVKDNNDAGSATSGDATTNITVLNLTGSQVIGEDSLLVFVNVLGKWVGVITKAPTGSTAAALGGGITQNNVANTSNIDATNSGKITNNVNLTSTSGNATVKDNNHAGNATSGNATASANITNMASSQFSLTHWFGILFINVFGSWNGSFGIDTAAGNTPSASSGSGQPNNSQLSPDQVKIFRFVPNGSSSGHRSLKLQPVSTNAEASTNGSGQPTSVLASTTSATLKPSLATTAPATPSNPQGTTFETYVYLFVALLTFAWLEETARRHFSGRA
jgi:hypothetical protein